MECLWGPGLGVPGLRGPLPPGEGPGLLQWRRAPDLSASRPPRCGTWTNRWLCPGGLFPSRLCTGSPLGLGFQTGKGVETLVEGSSQKSSDRVSSSFFCNLSARVNSAFRGRGSPAPPAFLQFQPLRRAGQGGVFLEVGRQL